MMPRRIRILASLALMLVPRFLNLRSGVQTTNIPMRSQCKANGEPPQIEHVDASTDLVTLTIGGNDAGFTSMLFVCSRALPPLIRRVRCNPSYAARKIARLAGPLERTLATIRARAAHAAVIALDYPQLSPASPAEQRCPALRPWAPAEQQVLRSAADELDGEIAQAATRTGVRFLDVRPVFAGHAVCDPQPWIVPPSMASLGRMARSLRLATEPFHPNAAGHQDGYLTALQSYIEQERQQQVPLTAAGLPANPPPAP